MKLLTYDKASDAYVYGVVTVQTLDNLKKLDGEATVIKGGLSIEIDYQTGGLEWKKRGHDIAFGFVKDGSVLVPDSFDSLAMASIYYNMELSFLFFRDDMGLGSQMPKRLPTYYDPSIQSIDEDGTRTREIDNAFYMKISHDNRGFFIVPFKQFQWIPMALNSGILTHEYTHYIFDILVLDNIYSLDDESANFMRSVNEATADFMAVIRTEDSNYMSHTVPEGLFVTPECNATTNMELSRDVSDPDFHKYNPMMDFVARHSDPHEYCPYEIGLFLASMLYEISSAIDGSDGPPSKKTLLKVGKLWLKALKDLGISMIGRKHFEIWEVLSSFVKRIEVVEWRNVACEIIEEHYSDYFDEIEGC